MTKRFLSLVLLIAWPGWLPALDPIYVKRATRADTEKASLAAIEDSFGNKGVKQSPWKIVGPFENTNGQGVRSVLPPEVQLDLSVEYSGVNGELIRWKDAPQFKDGEPVDLRGFFKRDDYTVCFLYRTIGVEHDTPAVIYTGSDDTIQVWFNGTLVNQVLRLRGVLRDEDRIPVELRKGTNTVLMKIGNFTGGFGFFYRLTTRTPVEDIDRQFLLTRLQEKLDDDFGSGEASYYRLESVHVPAHIVLEVGGMAFRSDGKMFICTRRGEVWLYDPKAGTWKLFAAGLHEPLGLLVVSNNEIIVAQRPELTRLKDTDGDGEADLFETVTDAFGVSGNYHEYHFGPVRDREGNLYGTLNLGWENLAFSRVPFRGWAYKVTPQGQFIPYALGLRSPSGIGMSPEGDIFVTDSQGDWWGASPLLHLKQGAFYGHPASLVWTRDYRGPQDPHMIPAQQLIPLKTSPAAWFVYGPLGQAPGEPLWDTTAGKFGPFAGQMFAGDETRSCMLRVALEKVGGEFQGAIFPFRFGFASGLLRGAFASDGTLYNGMTDRGWASVGGHSFGLQRVIWSGRVPMEVHSIKLTKTGFDLNFTKPVDPKTASLPVAYSLLYFHYLYHYNYGSPKQAETPVKVTDVKISADGRTVSLKVPGFVTQKIYEFHLNGIKAADGTELLHTEAYYTLNRTISEK